MTIYVVKPGDSLYMIAKNFNVSVQGIIDLNGLQDLPHLVVGQSLVIPTGESYYTVKSGDSLYTIARQFNVSPGSIAAINNLTYPYTLQPGQTISIPALAKTYGYIEVNAYIEPSTPDTETRLISEVGTFLTFLSPFSYRINADGSINPIEDTTILQTAKQFRDAPMMVITNFGAGNFDTELVHTVLSSDSIQQTLINNVLGIMKNKGYYGLNIDFERIRPEDRELYNNFLRKITAALHQQNYPVATALAPKTSGFTGGAWHGAHDYPAHGKILDWVILMTYEWGWSGGPPYAVAPIDLVRQVLEYALSVMPSSKIIMGIPLYGYDWKLPYVEGGPFAKRVSPVDAVNLAAKYNQAILYDQKTQSPHFNYYDESGTQHEVWFEDARSIQAKLRMASELALRGVSYWELGTEFPQNWAVLDNMFNIEKLVT